MAAVEAEMLKVCMMTFFLSLCHTPYMDEAGFALLLEESSKSWWVFCVKEANTASNFLSIGEERTGICCIDGCLRWCFLLSPSNWLSLETLKCLIKSK